MDANPPLIELTDIHKMYHVGEIDVHALKGVSLTIRRGEFVALTGASGSGKTTLMNILGCLDRLSSGVYRLEGREVSQLSKAELARVRGERIGFVFQNFNLLARTSALENVVMPTSYTSGNASNRGIVGQSKELLGTVGLEDRVRHEPSQLSGGQQQRVAVARALVNRPVLLLADEPTGNLDSNTSREILDMFERLNVEEGITVVLVTHNPEVAGRARRVIHISDGEVDSDTRREVDSQEADATPTPQIDRQTPKHRRFRGPLAQLRLLGHTVRIAVKALRRNILRSMLTTLGIIIGIAAVIAIMEIATGVSTAIQRTISIMGANTVLVLPGETRRGGVTRGSGSAMTLTPEDAEAIQRECPSVRYMAPIVRAWGEQVVYRNRNCVPRYLIGSTPAFFAVRNWREMFLGDKFTQRDVHRGSRVCVIGRTVAKNLFDDMSPVGEEVRINNEPFKVIGVLRGKGANLMGYDQDDIVLAPWTTVKYRVIGGTLATSQATGGNADDALWRIANSNYPYHCDPPELYPLRSVRQQTNTPQQIRITNLNQILVQAMSAETVPAATREIGELLAERHRIRGDEENDFRIRDLAEVSNALKKTVYLLSGMLLSVALVSLVVGGVGIMNIMLVSVTERTREIGLRMAVGATPGDILRQFLVEGMALCLLGGFIGLVVGRGSSILVGTLLGWPTEPSLLAAVTAVSVSVTVGLTFGYYPALKASRLDPIEALRYE